MEVTAESDGYKDYDQVDVRVTAGEIVKINPNPADHMVTVACRLPEEMPLCKLEIVTQMGLVVLSEPVLSGLSQKTMDIQHLTVGHYIVKLLTSEGIVLDAKTLIVQ